VATIKTQLVDGQRRIITKVVNGQRRVSCSCCEGEEGCCMYPAFAYRPDDSGLIKHEDLPDVIKTPAFSTDPAQTWLKLPAPIILAEDFALIYEATNNFNDEQFIRWDTDSGTNGTEGWNRLTGGGGIGTCLIDETFWRDDFADTYSFTAPDAAGTLARESLCVWRGDGRSLTFVVSNTFVGWAFGGVRKEGAQNTPVGNYGSAQIS
jgi:hypothetical protein